MNTSSEHIEQNKHRPATVKAARPEHSGTGEQGRVLTITVIDAGEEGGALICPTFSDADQLMYSTVTLPTWKDNAVSMSHSMMEGAKDKTKIMDTHSNMLEHLDKFTEKDKNNTDTRHRQRLDGMWWSVYKLCFLSTYTVTSSSCSEAECVKNLF